ncbi:MAG: alkaline phosphatase D family protein [Rickettsiales bacterium]
MSSLRKPAAGPVVGHTTSRSCRIWIAAGDPGGGEGGFPSENFRTIGVIALYDEQSKCVPKDKVYYFRLKREYDRTGTFNLGKDVSLWKDEQSRGTPVPLLPDSRYTVRLSTLALDDSFDNDFIVESEYIAERLPHPGVWAEALEKRDDLYAEASFVTAPQTPPGETTEISFLIGSCRYPGINVWKRKDSDRIFRPMWQRHADARFVMMLGDQIYADLLNRMIEIGRADSYKEFQDRYRDAFTSPHMCALLRRIPVYMTLDDHEIEDNWTQDRIRNAAKRELFNIAIGFYMSYQRSHGPRFEDGYASGRKMEGSDVCFSHNSLIRLFYDFNCGGYPFFVLDTRTQRYKDEMPGLKDNHMLGRPGMHVGEPSQIDYLCAWLRHMQHDVGDAPKFIGTSSVFVPNTVTSTLSDLHKEKSDAWDAFPDTRRKILKTILDHNVQNVVFLSGDVHCAHVAELFYDARPELKSYSVTSSAFHWPFPFADGNPSDFVHNSKDPCTPDSFFIGDNYGHMDYESWGYAQDNNFCRLTVTPGTCELRAQFFDANGSPLKRVGRNGHTLSDAPETLPLATW